VTTENSSSYAAAFARLVQDEWGSGPGGPIFSNSTQLGWIPYSAVHRATLDARLQIESASASGPLALFIFRRSNQRLVVATQPSTEVATVELFEALWRTLDPLVTDPQSWEAATLRITDTTYLLTPSSLPRELTA